MTARSAAQNLYDLFSSMRFAVSLLTVLAIASVVGTVLKQAEPYPNYLSQFGQFWFPVFETLGLYDVYHAGWFLAILAFLVASTGLCVYRNGPLMLREMRSYRERVTERSLGHFAHRAQLPAPPADPSLAERLGRYLAAHGYRYRARAAGGGGEVLLAAKAGSYHRLGYLFTHCGIVVICAGGLLDGNVPLKLMQLSGRIEIETRDIPQSQVPARSRLGADNLSFRGNVTIPEGSSTDVVFLNVGEGYLVQELPFTVALKKFYIEHYSTGQPKDFASDLVVQDKQTGAVFEHTIRVNHPLIYRGVAIYQASFADGGTRMQLTGWPLFSSRVAPFALAGAVNQSTRIHSGELEYRVEFSDFRPFNVENLASNDETGSRVQAASVSRKILAQLGSGAADMTDKDLRNVGPSFQYRLRDAQGQAREFNNYMLPLELDGRWYLMTGVRASPNETFRYLRLPLDAEGRLDEHMRLRAMLFDDAARGEIGRRFARNAAGGPEVSETLRERLAESAERVLELFARRGFEAVAEFLTSAVPQTEQEKAAEIYLKVLEGAAYEALQLARSRAGLPPAPADDGTARFVRDSLNAVSDSFPFGAPVYLQLNQYEEVKATGLQLTRSPGKNIVYGGSLLLVLGVFAMFYLRERRIWLLVKPAAGSVLFAMAGNRRTLEFEREFERHKRGLAEAAKG
jgi:cytochrome c biogenesis protein